MKALPAAPSAAPKSSLGAGWKDCGWVSPKGRDAARSMLLRGGNTEKEERN